MALPSVIPKQCAALTKKGLQCRNQARLGTSTCQLHTAAYPVILDSPLVKIAMAAFLEATLKIAAEETFEYVVRLTHHYRCEVITFKKYLLEAKVYRTFYLEGLAGRQAAIPAPKKPILLTAPAPLIPQNNQA